MNGNLLDLIVQGNCFLWYTLAYLLIVRWGFKEKTYGMPALCICMNVAWEILYTFVIWVNMMTLLGNILWLIFDLLILITFLKYGANEIRNPQLKRFFRPLMILGIALACGIEYQVAKMTDYPTGYLMGWWLALFIAILYPFMIKSRESVRGQTIYAPAFISLGTIFAYLWVMNWPDPTAQKLYPKAYTALFIPTLIIMIGYTVKVFKQCLKEGINPWKRFW